jgi:hypothetical protein
MPRARGSKNRQTVERETAKKIAAARAELVKNAPPLDFSMPLDSLDMMEHVVRRFYFRAKIAERLGDRVDRRRANAAFRQAVRAAEKVARYRHAQLSAIKLAGDINAKNYDNATLDELLVKIKAELTKLGRSSTWRLFGSRGGREPSAACPSPYYPPVVQGLEPAGRPFPACVAAAEAAGAVGAWGGHARAAGVPRGPTSRRFGELPC